MVKRRKRGERYGEGVIERKILLFVCDHLNGIEEPEIREWLSENCGVGEKKGITKHLAELEKKGFLIKLPQKGKENIWKPNPESYHEMAYEVILYSLYRGDSASFIRSEFAQFMITKYGFSLFEKKGFSVKDEYKEKLLFMLRLSPEVFYNLLKKYQEQRQEQREDQHMETLVQMASEAEKGSKLITTPVPTHISGEDVGIFEYYFFQDLTRNQFSYSKLPIEDIIRVFNFEKDAEGKCVHTITISSTFVIDTSGAISEIGRYEVLGDIASIYEG